MTQIRIAAETLPDALEAAIFDAREGDELVIERAGKIIARVVPEPPATDWATFLRELAELPALDPAFGEAVLEAVRAGKRPAEDVRWES